MAALRSLLRWRLLGPPHSCSLPGGPELARSLRASAGQEAAGPGRRGELGMAAGAAGGALACYLGYRLYERRVGRLPEPPRPRGAQTAAERRPAGAGEPDPARGLLPIPVAAAAKETITESRLDLEDLDLYATSREQRFRIFASLEFEGQLYMTPYDFIQSVTSDAPKRAKKWRSLSKQELNQILIETPPVWKGSSKLFRNLREKGLISYTEYLFLLCILTKPHAGFKIAFNMFDTDGNEMVDKKEFLVLQEIFRKKNEKRERKGDEEKRIMLRLQLYGYHTSTNSGITFDEFRSFFQFLNNLEDFAIAMQMYNFANRSIGQDEFKRAVYVATGLKLSAHLVNTVFKIFDVDRDDQLSYKEFIGIMKDRLNRGFRGYKTVQRYTTFKACVKKELYSR
ncbi:calcium uptake protein 3, mitochondrial isoform X10 [Caretta caretta]|uniref:calcium uptake protein 3, mitochondrial isoform X10 n=1 Tax=Caretta caretta TaxID=8467 RepID=UPI003F4C352C